MTSSFAELSGHYPEKKNPGYELTLTVNSAPFSVGSREEIRMPSVRPFWGKGSPEDCQVVLQLALLFNLTTALILQSGPTTTSVWIATDSREITCFTD